MNTFQALIDLLRSDGSIIVNKNLAFAIGLEPAIVYTELVSKYDYFLIREDLTEDGYFYNTVDNFRLDTTLPDKRQRKAINKLEKLKLIKTDLRGIPPKRHFKIIKDSEMVIKLLGKGKFKREELEEKLAMKTDISKKRYIGKIDSSKVAETNTPIWNVNNTNSNYTNLNNTKKTNRGSNQKSDSHPRIPSFSFKEILDNENIAVNELAKENIQRFLKGYKVLTHKSHPRLKLYQWMNVIKNITTFTDDHDNIIEIFNAEFKAIVKSYFNEFDEKQYNLNHLVSGDIMKIRYYDAVGK